MSIEIDGMWLVLWAFILAVAWLTKDGEEEE